MATGITFTVDPNWGSQRDGTLRKKIGKLSIAASTTYTAETGVAVDAGDFDLTSIVDIVPCGGAADLASTPVGYMPMYNQVNESLRLFKSAGSAAGMVELTTDTGGEIIELRVHVYGT